MDGREGEQPHRTIEELERLLEETRRALRRRTEEAGLLRLQLDVLSTTEPTTGLLNRGGLVDAVETALQRLGRLGEPFAVVGIRIPALAGLGRDPAAMREALRHVGGMIAAGLRDLDRTGRLDDTTFVAVASLKTPAAYAAVLDRLRTVLTAGALTAGRTVDPDPRFCVVLGESPARADAVAVVQMAEGLLADASEGATPLVRL